MDMCQILDQRYIRVYTLVATLSCDIFSSTSSVSVWREYYHSRDTHTVPYFQYVLHVLKDCEFIVAHKTLTRTLFHAQLKWYCYNHARHKVKYAKLCYGPQNHGIALLTDTQDIPK